MAYSLERFMTLEQIRGLVTADFEAVDKVVKHRLHSQVALVDQVATYIIYAGGKRLRPLLVLLAARACGHTGGRHIDAAAIIEFIHTATLLHDDVVDGSSLRRGRETANEVFGNATSVLVGDFLYSRAFQMMVTLDRMRVMQILADATNAIAEGEVLQLMNARDPHTTEARYIDVIRRKTARLFEAGAQIAAVLSDAPPVIEESLARYGRHIGTAFQLVDDALDYQADESSLGKHLGDDLAEGKPTLPLIYAMQHGNVDQQAMIRHAIEHGGLGQLAEITRAVASLGGLAYTARLAQREADEALAALKPLPESAFKEGLSELAKFAVARKN
jgi:octaprenyl-diphosphate synthase